MPSTRQTQPYRKSGGRAPSQVLSMMLAGQAAGGNALVRAAAAPRAKGARKRDVQGIVTRTPQQRRV